MIGANTFAQKGALRPAHWQVTGLFLVATALVGPQLGAIARPLFLAGCIGVGWYAWSRSPSAHFQTVLALFCFAPFLRRLVDATVGFDQGGLMVAGPLLALLVTLPELRKLANHRCEPSGLLAPLFIFSGCVLYSAILTMSQGEWPLAAVATLKWTSPVIYVLALSQQRINVDEFLRDATTAFVVTLPIMGVYGLYQYVDPPVWDRYWLALAAITSAGLPMPYAVRTFSTMHSPASFATYTAFGLTLVYFLRPSFTFRLMMLPAALALMLSLYRTAWLSMVASVLFCLFFSTTRWRAAGTILVIGLATVVAALLTPFGDVILDRFSTMSEGSNDGSSRERLNEFLNLWQQADSGIVGSGFIAIDTGTAGAAPLDGMIAICWANMGIVVGILCLGTLLIACFRALTPMTLNGRREHVILWALTCGWLVQLPLAGIAAAEFGFLFWMTTYLASISPMSIARKTGKLP